MTATESVEQLNDKLAAAVEAFNASTDSGERVALIHEIRTLRATLAADLTRDEVANF